MLPVPAARATAVGTVADAVAVLCLQEAAAKAAAAAVGIPLAAVRAVEAYRLGGGGAVTTG